MIVAYAWETRWDSSRGRQSLPHPVIAEPGRQVLLPHTRTRRGCPPSGHLLPENGFGNVRLCRAPSGPGHATRLQYVSGDSGEFAGGRGDVRRHDALNEPVMHDLMPDDDRRASRPSRGKTAAFPERGVAVSSRLRAGATPS